MGTNVTIDSRGLVQSDAGSGSSSFGVGVPMTVNSLSHSPTVTSMSLGNNVLSSPGFYWIPGLNSTGTLPPASAVPGTSFVFSQPAADLGPGAFLTGSNGSTINSPTDKVFFLSGSVNFRGSNLTMPSRGTTQVVSDGKYWCVNQLSGSVTLT